MILSFLIIALTVDLFLPSCLPIVAWPSQAFAGVQSCFLGEISGLSHGGGWSLTVRWCGKVFFKQKNLNGCHLYR